MDTHIHTSTALFTPPFAGEGDGAHKPFWPLDYFDFLTIVLVTLGLIVAAGKCVCVCVCICRYFGEGETVNVFSLSEVKHTHTHTHLQAAASAVVESSCRCTFSSSNFLLAAPSLFRMSQSWVALLPM
jgi:hypothetical protein